MTASTPRIEGYDDLVVIGRGGFSTVYAATQVDLGRRVAVKVLNFDVSDGAAQRRFERECKVVGMLTGAPGVVGVHTPAFTDDGRPCIVMQLMEGGTLQSHVLDYGPVSPDEACELTQRLAEALAAAHAKDVAHRDIKPGNVLLTADHQPALADFGIAVVEHLAYSSQTAESLSPPFAAPERLLGGEIDEKRADIYSLGATVCFALTGAAPFGTAQRGGVSGLVRRVLEDPPPNLEVCGVPRDFASLVGSMLAKRPEDRPESAVAIAQSAERIAADATRIVLKPPAATNEQSAASPSISMNPPSSSSTSSFGYSLDPSASQAVAAVTGLGLTSTAADPAGAGQPPYNPPADPFSALTGYSWDGRGAEVPDERDAGVWPTAVDYAQSIQDSSNLLDPGLARVTLQEDMLGMPVSAAGQSAVVFHVLEQDVGVAVRFFTRPPRDGRIRYRALGEHLEANPCAPVVSTRWIEEAISVGEHDRPAVWMPWAEGRPLNLLVEDLLTDPRRLQSLAELFLDVLDELRESGMAHGDLQNGNVLVTGDLAISLVDLDGVWVPSLAGNPPAETGHLCFQHRARSTRHWGPEMDTFSGFLIYVSLVALSVDPELWRFHQGENLILSAQDLQQAPNSEAWRALMESRSVHVQSLAQRLADLATAPEPPTATVRELVEEAGGLNDVTLRRSSGSVVEAGRSANAAPVTRRAQPKPVASGSNWWIEPQGIDVPDPGGAVAARSASAPSESDSQPWVPPVTPTRSVNSRSGSPGQNTSTPAAGWRSFARNHCGIAMGLVGICCGLAGVLTELLLFRTWESGADPMEVSTFVIMVTVLGLFGGMVNAWPDLLEGRSRSAAGPFTLGALIAGTLTFSATFVVDGVVNPADGTFSEATLGYVGLVVSLTFGVALGAVGFVRSARRGLILAAAGMAGGLLAAIPITMSRVQVSSTQGVFVPIKGELALAIVVAMALVGLVVGIASKKAEEVQP